MQSNSPISVKFEIKFTPHFSALVSSVFEISFCLSLAKNAKQSNLPPKSLSAASASAPLFPLPMTPKILRRLVDDFLNLFRTARANALAAFCISASVLSPNSLTALASSPAVSQNSFFMRPPASLGSSKPLKCAAF